MENIYSKLTSKVIESSIIYGQKRVGKTSIAKIIKAKLEKDSNYTVVFITVGDLDKTTTLKFVTNLGDEIFYEIRNTLGKIVKDIEPPTFDGALSPLVRYFKEIKKIDSNRRFIIIIDEFDEIPTELKYYTSVGDTFFHNIRSLSSGNQIGFLLVGAENMQIIKQSTDRLNKFDSFRVDYFDKSKHWKDFNELVSRPTQHCLEYNDEAITQLYEITEGNPFFTKLVCANIFSIACDKHNSFISNDEVKEAIREAIRALDTNQFNHFWKDGINEDNPAKIDNIETQRRKLLISYSEIKRINRNIKKSSDLSESPFCKSVAIDEIFQSFSNRDILVQEGECFRLRPRIFENWLIEYGSKSLTSTLLDERTFEAMKSKEAEAFVKDQELADLVGTWDLYRGSKITEQQVRRWLNQFSDNIESRIMFNLLKHIKFYGEPSVREKLRIIHQRVKSEVIHEIKEGEKSRRDILLSSFGVPSKSGSLYARYYATENKIYTHNIVAFDNINSKLENNNDVKALIFVEDIIASGESACNLLQQLEQKCGDLLHEREIKVFIGAICGFRKGLKNVYDIINKLKFKAEIEIIDELTEEDQCLSERSSVFEIVEERKKAEEIIRKYGNKLQKKQPLGYKNCQLLVVFHDACPNNTLPILWASSASDFVWNPLFKRG